jgi:type II secretory pathway component PulK
MRPRPAELRSARRGRGTILITTIWILLVLAGLVVALAHAVRVESLAAANRAAAAQALAAENAGVQYVLAHLDGLSGSMPDEGAMPTDGVQVGDGAFWVIRPADEADPDTARFGVVGESAKVDLNAAPLETIAALPEMTAELAASIVDWRDDDSDLTTEGAESEYYLLLSDPYECKNDRLETVAEVLLVKGGTAEVLYGEDRNRNGVLDAGENDGADREPPDDSDGKLDAGIQHLVTVFTAEPNVDAEGGQRININQSGMNELAEALTELFGEDRSLAVMSVARRERPFTNVIDFRFRSGLRQEEFAQIADRLTTSDDETLRGRINVLTAPSAVLACLPGLDAADVAKLLTAREGLDASEIDPGFAWVAEALDREKAIAIGGSITSRTWQFSADIVSVSPHGRAFRRCRIVVDGRFSPPRVLHRQDLTHLGWPLDDEVRRQLRAGTGIADVLAGQYQETP